MGREGSRLMSKYTKNLVSLDGASLLELALPYAEALAQYVAGSDNNK